MERTALGLALGVVAFEVVSYLRQRKQRITARKLKQAERGDLLPNQDSHGSLQYALAHVERNIGDVVLGPKLGSGSFGVVYQGRWKGSSVAVKVILHQRSGYASNESTSREVMIGKASVHPNIVAVYDVFTERLQQNAFADQSTAAFNLQTSIVMEMCDKGSLYKRREDGWRLLKQDASKGLQWVLKSLLEIAFAMEFLQTLSIIHGDLKCANVLCKSSTSDFRGFTCKVCDFGLANTMSGLQSSSGSSQAGTLIFAAPEVLCGSSLSACSDVYSFGMLAWHLFCMGMLDTDLKEHQIYHQVVEIGWRPALPDNISPATRDWINRCWLADPQGRPTFIELRHLLTEQLFETQRLVK